jgi:hypothetical protein
MSAGSDAEMWEDDGSARLQGWREVPRASRVEQFKCACFAQFIVIPDVACSEIGQVEFHFASWV